MRYIIGIGNYLMYDDSAGIRVVNHLVENFHSHFPDLEFIDLSSRVFDLISYCDEKSEHIVIIDTGKINLEPGECRLVRLNKVKGSHKKGETLNVDVHSTDLFNVLDFAKKLYKKLPIIDLLIIQPQEIKLQEGISPELATRIEEYAKLAIDALSTA